MTEADVFAKLSRILETTNLSNDNNEDADDFLERFSYDLADGRKGNNSASEPSEPGPASGRRPTPFEVWKSKQADTGKKKQTPKLSSEQWDGLVGHLHKTNKLKESAVMKEQNQGLAAEFSGHQFKPQMNPRSQELMANKRESLHQRVAAIVQAHEAVLTRKRASKAEAEMAECSFKPKRVGESTSDKYLKKLGRQVNQHGIVDPEYFFKYHEEKLRRNAIRQQIVNEMTARELTFKPTQNAKSVAMQHRLKQAQAVAQRSMSSASGMATPDAKTRSSGNNSAPNSARSPALSARSIPSTPVAKASPAVPFSTLSKVSTQKILQQPNKLLAEAGCGDPTAGDYFGAPVVVESCHPYKHNTMEYTTVNIHGALSYSITFDENTRTEPIHDYVKFFADDTHTDYYGCGKYSGGLKVLTASNYGTTGQSTPDTERGKPTASNWPGIGGRPPLIIPAGRFVVCFRTNGSVNDWGFKLYATPLISGSSTAISRGGEAPHREGHPVISERGKLYRSSNATSSDISRDEGGAPSNVYTRLHQEAMTKTIQHHNQIAEQMQSKLNITMKPWEAPRRADGSGATSSWAQNKTYLAKRNASNGDFSDMLVRRPSTRTHRHGHGNDENSTAGAANANANAVLSVASLQDDSSADGGTEVTTTSQAAPYSILDFDESVSRLWRCLREATPAVPSGATGDGDDAVTAGGAAAAASMPEI